jgi:hypothetical protein
MDTSILIAKLMGPVMLVLGLALWLNGKGFRAMAKEFLKSDALIFLAGLIALSLGVTLVVFHNVWVADWPLIVTVIGWASLIAGIARLMWPNWLRRMASGLIERKELVVGGGAIYVVLGALLIYFGFLA